MPETTPSDVEETFESDDIRETDLFPEEQIPGAATLFSGDSFDLGKELSGFADEIDFDLPRTDKEDSGFNLESMTGFKKNELNNEDAESHYSLGLAYKEMGLFDEAIDEFIVASNSPERQIDCQVLQGVCLREKGEPAQAVEHLEEILDQPNLSETEILGIKYELAICHETTGYKKLAKQLFNEIIAISPNFSDTADRLSRL
jgi:tetratricopeptide (TPR) repeat protein